MTKVTPRRVIYGLIGLNLAMALAMEWPFIIGALEVRCALQFNQGLYANGTSSVLFVLCFILCCVDFVVTWLHIPRCESSRVVAVAYSPADPTAAVVAIQEVNDREPLETVEMQNFNILSATGLIHAAASSVDQHQVSDR